MFFEIGTALAVLEEARHFEFDNYVVVVAVLLSSFGVEVDVWFCLQL
jgi:hypothetical protein